MRTQFLIYAILSSTFAIGQSTWKKINLKNLSKYSLSEDVIKRKELPKGYTLYKLDVKNFRKKLKIKPKGIKTYIELPNKEKGFTKFYTTKISCFSEKLAKKYPNIISYKAQAINDPKTSAKISIGTDGVHVVISSIGQKTLYIDPHTKDNKTYRLYEKPEEIQKHICKTVKKNTRKLSKKTIYKNTKVSNLRTFRIALACTNEYAQFHLKQQGIKETATKKIKKTAILSAFNTTLTRVNQIYERDLSIKMILVDNNDLLIPTDYNKDDNLSNNNMIKLLYESQELCDYVIGNTKYDIGHTMSTDIGGVAVVGGVCSLEAKANGVTGSKTPINDSYDVDFVAHEIGHQFGADHTFGTNKGGSCNGQRVEKTAVEPGSGSTIMGYSGLCGSSNIQKNSDDYFHHVSIQEIEAYIDKFGQCANIKPTNNNRPTANAGNNYTIPTNTPFQLRGTANDIDNENSLSYCWEQIDNEDNGGVPKNNSLKGPVFRSFKPTSSPIRYIPQLRTLIKGKLNTKWEKIPSVPRNLNFSLTVRDNSITGGTTASDTMKVTIISGNPFIVSSQNEKTTWITGDTKKITWDVSNTDKAPINCKKINIKLSIDGGKTFPIFLAKETKNDGSETIIVPDSLSENARIMVEASDNIFFNINSHPIKITSKKIPFKLSTKNNQIITCSKTGTASYDIDVQVNKGFNGKINFETFNLPKAIKAKISPKFLNGNGKITVTLNFDKKTRSNSYNINIKAKTKTHNTSIKTTLSLIYNTNETIKLISPQKKEIKTTVTPNFKWDSVKNIDKYTFEISTDSMFKNIIEKAIITDNNYNLNNKLNYNTNYFWRIKSKDKCGTISNSEFSTFKTSKKSKYCISTFSDSNSISITKVKFNTILNRSEDETGNGYEDYTALNTTVKTTKSYTLDVTLNNDKNNTGVTLYIDWNKDFEFDSGETYDLGTLNNNNNNKHTLSKKIEIPKIAKLGKTRMRIVATTRSPEIEQGPCSSNRINNKTNDFNQNGETEDYTLIISDIDKVPEDDNLNPPSSNTYSFFEDFSIYPNPVKNNLLTIQSPYKKNKLNIIIYDSRGRVIKKIVLKSNKNHFKETISLKEISNGTYIFILHDNTDWFSKKIIIMR